MNRKFFSSEEGMDPCHEVQVIKKYMDENLIHGSLRMFLDIHAHSVKKGIFAYAPVPESNYGSARTKCFSLILDDMSEVFSIDNCRYNNDRQKKNCARLGIFNQYELDDSYTIESSCYGFESKTVEGTKTIQFTVRHFIEFGKSLSLAIARHLFVASP